MKLEVKYLTLFFTMLLLIFPSSYQAQIKLSGTGDRILTMTWSPDGNYIAIGKINTATTILDEIGGHFKGLSDQADAIVSVDWNHAGNLLSSASLDLTINIWDVELSDVLFELSADPINVSSVSWSFDDNYLASGGHTGFKIWDTNNGSQLVSYSTLSPVTFVDFHHSDQKLLYSFGDKAVTWDKNTNSTIATFDNHTSKVVKALWNNELNQIVSASEDQSIKIWDETGSELHSLEHDASLTDMTLSPDGNLVAATTTSNTFWIWDLSTGEKIVKYNSSDIIQHDENFDGIARKIAWNPVNQSVIAIGFDSLQAYSIVYVLDLNGDLDNDGKSNFDEMKEGANILVHEPDPTNVESTDQSTNTESTDQSTNTESTDSLTNKDDANLDKFFLSSIILIIQTRRLRQKKIY